MDEGRKGGASAEGVPIPAAGSAPPRGQPERPFGLHRIGQIAQVVHDVERARAFYRGQLGMRLVHEVPERMAFFDCDGTWLMLSLPEGEGQDHPGSVLYFDVEDMDAAYGILGERGVPFLRAPARIADMGDHELWMAFFEDPDANMLALRARVPK
ncbi:MAG TPA: VOC family protein [Longimicrobiales bacterium]|nr:VOC family protein [Longimicrobiales bacterium]